jgi:hypothetical protein
MWTPKEYVIFHTCFVGLWWDEHLVQVEGLRCAYNFSVELWMLVASLKTKVRFPSNFCNFRVKKKYWLYFGTFVFIFLECLSYALSTCFNLLWTQYTVLYFAYTVKILCSFDIYKNSLAWVHERTITTERTPLVSEVSANFCG